MRKNSSPEASLTRLPSGKTKHIHRENHANMTYSGYTPLINPFISDATDKSDVNKCNALGCYQYANIEVQLKIGNKSISVVVCKNCEHKFRDG